MAAEFIATMGDVPGGQGGRTTIWDHAMNTLSQVLVALVISVIVRCRSGLSSTRESTFEPSRSRTSHFGRAESQCAGTRPKRCSAGASGLG